MPDYYGGVAQAGAQMMNSGVNAMIAQRKLEAEKEMQAERIAAQERMQSARMSAGGGSFGGNDPVSRTARNHQGVVEGLNAASDAQIDLMAEREAKQKSISDRGYGTDEDRIALQKIDARIANNDYALKMMTKSLNGGKFEYSTTDADGSTVKAVFDSAADLEMYKATFRGNSQEAAAQKNSSLLGNIFGEQKTAPIQSPQSAETDQVKVEPVPRQKSEAPEGFVGSDEEEGKKQYEVDELRKELAKRISQREAEAKNTGYRPNVVVGAAGAGVATSGKSKPSDKERASNVRNLDKEIAKLKSRLGESGN